MPSTTSTSVTGAVISISIVPARFSSAKSRIEITVTSTRPDQGRISDVIYVDTDSPIRPTLQVTVSGTIIDAKKETP